jgi:lipopolysaccharide biosynthesis glycosyltransferase
MLAEVTTSFQHNLAAHRAVISQIFTTTEQKRNTPRNVIFFVVDDKYIDVAIANAKRLRKISGNADVIIFYEGTRDIKSDVARVENGVLRKSLLTETPESLQWPKIVYYRMFAPALLAGQYDKALYLDADVALANDVHEIFSLDLAGYPVAAVHDTGVVTRSDTSQYNQNDRLSDLGLEPTRYFNSGVMLIDVDEWSSIDFNERLRDFIAERGGYMHCWDQDFLNYLFKDNWLEISHRWNFQYTLFGRGIESVIQPSIYHYTHTIKPWYDTEAVYDPSHHNYFASILRNAGYDSVASSYSGQISPLNRLRLWFRQFKLESVLFRSRKNRKMNEWKAKNRQYLEFIALKINNRSYADVEAGITTLKPFNENLLFSDVRLENGRFKSSLSTAASSAFLEVSSDVLH